MIRPFAGELIVGQQFDLRRSGYGPDDQPARR